jgi:ADP-ribose pyrophosphatase YjhB (NUDIX family)
MYKVFFNDNFLIIATRDERVNSKSLVELGTHKQMVQWADDVDVGKEKHNAIFFTNSIKTTWKKFCSHFKIIEAAGGLVHDDKSHYLCIFRRGKWDLPKGKLDKGETPAKAAVREVQEETGLHDIGLEKHLINTYHIYKIKRKLVLKFTYWYLMKNMGNGKLIPQTSEDIEKAVWLKPSNIKELTGNMFGSVKDVFLSEKVI